MPFPKRDGPPPKSSLLPLTDGGPEPLPETVSFSRLIVGTAEVDAARTRVAPRVLGPAWPGAKSDDERESCVGLGAFGHGDELRASRVRGVTRVGRDGAVGVEGSAERDGVVTWRAGDLRGVVRFEVDDSGWFSLCDASFSSVATVRVRLEAGMVGRTESEGWERRGVEVVDGRGGIEIHAPAARTRTQGLA